MSCRWHVSYLLSVCYIAPLLCLVFICMSAIVACWADIDIRIIRKHFKSLALCLPQRFSFANEFHFCLHKAGLLVTWHRHVFAWSGRIFVILNIVAASVQLQFITCVNLRHAGYYVVPYGNLVVSKSVLLACHAGTSKATALAICPSVRNCKHKYRVT